VAVIALHQTLIDAVVERFGKIRFGRGVAAVAQLRLVLDEEVLLFLGVMRRVAIQAADLAAGMGGLRKMGLLVPLTVTSQATSARLLPGVILEYENLGFVAPAGDMFRAWTVAAFAALLRRSARFIEGGLPVRRLLPGIVKVFVTGLASLGAHVLGGIRGRRPGCGSRGRWSALNGSLRVDLARGKGNHGEKKYNVEHRNSRDPGIYWH